MSSSSIDMSVARPRRGQRVAGTLAYRMGTTLSASTSAADYHLRGRSYAPDSERGEGKFVSTARTRNNTDRVLSRRRVSRSRATSHGAPEL